MRRAKIVATLGPATSSYETVRALIDAGVDVARLNLSHGDTAVHEANYANVRRAADDAGRAVAVLVDLQGPKIRLGKFADGPHELAVGDIFKITTEDILGTREICGTTFKGLPQDVKPGDYLLIDDGKVRVEVVETDGTVVTTRVTVAGAVSNNKGINLPGVAVNVPALSEKDEDDLRWGLRTGADLIALSFVRDASDVTRVHEIMAEEGVRIPVIAKIEKPQAIMNLDSIIEASDAIMVARGDLGVEMDVAKVPVIQKYILARCSGLGKPCIVATQMLETMIESMIPTRAEASDVANAVLDGCDAVMLSGETAVGAHPDVVVETMQKIIRVTESRMDEILIKQDIPTQLKEYPFRSVALAKGVWYMAEELHARAIAVWSEAGGMARYLSQHNFRVPIYAYTSSLIAARRMALYVGVTPIYTAPPESGRLSDWTDMVEDLIRSDKITEDGDTVLLVAGKPLGALLAQSTVSILRMGDPASGFRQATTV